MKGMPSGYNKDLQEDKEAVFDAEATLAGSLEVGCDLWSKASRWTPTARAGRRHGLLLATDVADYLVAAGCRSAARTSWSARMMRQAAAEGRDFESLSLGRVARVQRPVRGRRRRSRDGAGLGRGASVRRNRPHPAAVAAALGGAAARGSARMRAELSRVVAPRNAALLDFPSTFPPASSRSSFGRVDAAAPASAW